MIDTAINTRHACICIEVRLYSDRLLQLETLAKWKTVPPMNFATHCTYGHVIGSIALLRKSACS